MQTDSLSKYSISFGVSLAVASVINAILVIAKEKNQAVMAEMQRITGHHWITHSVFVVLLFATLGFLLAQVNGRRKIRITGDRLISILLAGVVTGAVTIIGFYLLGG